MDDQKLYILLRIILNNRNLNGLLRENLNFREIANLTDHAIRDNLIESKEGGIELTAWGKAVFDTLELEFKKRKKEQWIDPERSSQISQLDIDFIYLPNQHKLNLD